MSEEIPEPWPDAGKSLQERRAYNEFFEKYHTSVYNLAYKLTGNKEVAEEIASTVIKNYFDAGYDPDKGARKLLNEMTKNDCIKSNAGRLPIKVSYHYIENEPSTDLGPEQLLDLKFIYEWIDRVVDELPEACQRVFRLSLKGLTNVEIAKQLKMNPSTVGNHKKYAKLKLKAAYPRVDWDDVLG
jgi:RNA polymerase sigma factor (sigma-70 family)